MTRQRTIFGTEEQAPGVASAPSCEVLALFASAPSMRGQLSAWAESVCGMPEREGNRLDDWALEVTS